MGLLVTKDGRYKGWLATFLCCCAAVNDDEYPAEKEKQDATRLASAGVARVQPCFDNAPPRYIAQRGLTPLDFPEEEEEPAPPLYRHSTVEVAGVAIPGSAKHCRQSSSGHAKRPSISAPSSFRRVEFTEGQRRSLIPLHLGPIVLRAQPNEEPQDPPREHVLEAQVRPSRSNSAQGSLQHTSDNSYRQTKDTPYERCQQHRSGTSSFKQSPQSSRNGTPEQRASSAQETRLPRPSLSTRSSSSGLHQHSNETHSRPGRSSSDPLRPKQRPPCRRADRGVEQEILELNTIIEEKRAEAARSRAAEDHIPAVAPSMQVRARTETLEGIGSAFSRPWATRDPLRIDTALRQPQELKQEPRYPSRTSSRASGRALHSIHPERHAGLLPHATCGAPTEACQSPATASHRSSVTNPESPPLTCASSHTFKTHSRTLTAESHPTPLSPLPPACVYELDVQIEEGEEKEGTDQATEPWRTPVAKNGQVGLAF